MLITSTIGLLELLWSMAVLIGLIAVVRRIISVEGDLRARRRSKRNGLLYAQARSDLRNEIVRLIVLLGLVPFAYAALTTRSRPNLWHLDLRLLVTLGLLCIPFAIAYDSIRTEQTRRYILRELGEYNGTGEEPNSH